MAKRFWLGMLHRVGLKRTDKLMVGNIDSSEPDYIDVSEILSVLSADDLQESANRKWFLSAERTKLTNLPTNPITASQGALIFYPISGNPSNFLTAASNLDGTKILGIVPIASIPNLDAAKINTGSFGEARIGVLPASKITSGVFDVARIPDLPASKITGLPSGTGDAIPLSQKGAANGVAPLDASALIGIAYIPDMATSKITSGTFNEDRIPAAFMKRAELGMANGPASLGADGKVPLSQLPDDIGGGTIPTPTNRGAFTGSLPFTNPSGGYFDPYDLATSGTITFAAGAGAGVLPFNSEYVKVISDGVTPFATESNMNAVFDQNEQYGIPSDYILPAGIYTIYFWKTPEMAAISIPGYNSVSPPSSGDIPVITLNGPNPMYIELGDTYVEPGANASDTEDGDISGDILVTGTVNPAAVGTYYKRYNVQDSDLNNASEVVRTVIVSDNSDHDIPNTPSITSVLLSYTAPPDGSLPETMTIINVTLT